MGSSIEWLRPPKAGTVVIFIHGLLSSGEAAWSYNDRINWPNLLLQEKEFESLGICVFSYRTDLFSGSYSVGDVIDSLRETFLKSEEVKQCRRRLQNPT